MIVRRALDILVVLISLPIVLPVVAVLALFVWRYHGRPILFSQDRAGLNGKIFRMYKFRSMTAECGPDGRLLPDDRRLTRFGSLLRSTSLDELPSLWNVLTGDLAIVGPRPLLVDYLPLYSPRQARRHEVRPGITGWAQVRGRNSLSWEDKFDLDVWYVDNRSIWLDARIVMLTVFKVIKREGISEDGGATMHRFTGSDS